MSNQLYILPRYLRLRDCPRYLGMDRHRFNSEVRPCLIPIPIGKQGIAFDRLDLDAWADHYKSCSGRPPDERKKLWDAKERRVSTNVGNFGILINKYSDDAFEKALVLSISKKRNDISRGASKK